MNNLTEEEIIKGSSGCTISTSGSFTYFCAYDNKAYFPVLYRQFKISSKNIMISRTMYRAIFEIRDEMRTLGSTKW